MSTNNKVFQVLVAKADSAILAAGNTVDDLAVGQIGIFDAETNLSIDKTATNKKNFYLEVLPNKNCPRIKDCKEALDYLKVPAEEYIYYRQDGHEKDPIRSRYKVPVLYINLRRLRVKLNCFKEQAVAYPKKVMHCC